MTDSEHNDKEQQETTGEESFAELFEKSYRRTARLEPGEKIEARILKITPEWVFLDTGQKGEGVVDRKEFLDGEGNLAVAEGDTVIAFFLSAGRNELRFTTRIGGGPAGNAQLEEAWRSGIPVEGFVEKEVKGGFEVKIAGSVRAFCPFSQMGLKRAESQEYVGSHLSFRVTEYGEKGRNIILSRRALLEEEQQRRKEEARERLTVGMTITGTIVSLRDFGAFVDLGGIEGLVPVSEIGWGRVENVRDVLAVGETVTAVIKGIDWGKERITLSIRDTLADPWEGVAERFPEGSFHHGRVARLAPFGAFVTLAGGVDGLIHISRLGAGKRINHPREVLKEGEEIEVKVEGIDRERRRLSLSPAGTARAAEEEEASLAAFRTKSGEIPTGMGTLGDLLKAKLEKKKK